MVSVVFGVTQQLIANFQNAVHMLICSHIDKKKANEDSVYLQYVLNDVTCNILVSLILLHQFHIGET